MNATPNCPVCGATSAPLFYAGEHRMFRCRECFLAFVYPTPLEAYLADFYSRFHMVLEQGGGYELLEDRMSADFPTKVETIQKNLASKTAKILDVGCGKGYFVKACVDQGINAEGIDLSDTAINYAKNILGVNARCGRIEDTENQIGAYDGITFWATIEHLPDPLKTLRAINTALKPGGLLFLDTGIGHDWLDRLLPGVNQWYDPPQHLFVFSEEAIRIALTRTGFEVEKVDTCFERTPVRRVARIVRGASAALGLRIITELTRTGGGGPFRFTRFPLGNLISVVARKPDLNT